MPPYVALVPLADIAPVVRSNERGRQLRRPQALDPTRKEVRVGPAYSVARVVAPRHSAKTKLTIITDEYRTCSRMQKANSAAGRQNRPTPNRLHCARGWDPPTKMSHRLLHRARLRVETGQDLSLI